MAKVNNCTKETPMPQDRDRMGQHWVHHDFKSETIAGQNYVTCTNCGEQFIENLKATNNVKSS